MTSETTNKLKIDLKTEKERLEKACDLIKHASALVDHSSRIVQPYRINKALNVMMHTLEVDAQVLRTILGTENTKWIANHPDFETPAFKLLKAEVMDK